MFLPLVVEAGDGVKICITESDLEGVDAKPSDLPLVRLKVR